MGRYGAIDRYGSQLFGSGTNENWIWVIQIDWDGDEVFGGYNEAPWVVGLDTERGREFFLKPEGEGFEGFRVGTANIHLINEDGRFDAFDEESDLYPNVEAGKFMQIYVRDGVTGSDHYVFAGKVEDIDPYRRNDEDFVKISCADGYKWLRNEETNISLQKNISIGDAIGLILDDIGWPSIWGRDLDTGVETVPYFWESGRSAFRAIRDLIDAEGGQFYVANDGTATFRDRNTSQSPIVTIDQSEMGRDFSIPQPWEVERNIVRIDVNPMVARSSVEVWRLGSTPQISAGGHLDMIVNLQYDNRPVVSDGIDTPVASTDYTANTASDGSGTDLTSDFDVTVLADFGSSAKIRIENNHGSLAGYPTLTRIRADVIDSPYSFYLEEDSSGSDQPRVFRIRNKNIQTVSQAENLLAYYSNLLLGIREFPTIHVEHRFSEQFDPDLTKNVSLNIPSKGILNQGYRCGLIRHLWLNDTGQSVRTEFAFEPFFAVDIFELDIDSLDIGKLG